MPNYNSKYKGSRPVYKKQPERTALEVIFVGIFKALWWLVKLPFKSKTKKRRVNQTDRAEITARRQEIEKLLVSENEIELKHAVMEADKLVDQVLKIKGFQGETFADRLRSAESSIDRVLYDQIWQGHKVRNMLAHEHGTRITPQELRGAVERLLRYIKDI